MKRVSRGEKKRKEIGVKTGAFRDVRVRGGSAVRRDAPTSPSTVHSSRLPRFPGRGPLGATAASVAASGGVPGALGGGRVALPPRPVAGPALSKPVERAPKSTLLCAGVVARVLSPPWLGGAEPSGRFTLRTRILRRGAGLPPGASRGPGGPRGRWPATLIARTQTMVPFWFTRDSDQEVLTCTQAPHSRSRRLGKYSAHREKRSPRQQRPQSDDERRSVAPHHVRTDLARVLRVPRQGG